VIGANIKLYENKSGHYIPFENKSEYIPFASLVNSLKEKAMVLTS
jgi:hypothetical protein